MNNYFRLLMLYDILIEPNIWISKILNFIFNNYYVIFLLLPLRERGEWDKLNLIFWVLRKGKIIIKSLPCFIKLHEINLSWSTSWINDDDLQVARNLTLLLLSCAILIFICFSPFTQWIDPKNNVYLLFFVHRGTHILHHP